MLIPGFYKILDFNVSNKNIEATLLLNKDHNIYKGHFPGQPVVPGVIQLQIIKEILEKSKNEKLFLSKVGTAKYLKMISPDISGQLLITIQYEKTEEGEYTVNALIGSEENVFTKVKAILKRLP